MKAKLKALADTIRTMTPIEKGIIGTIGGGVVLRNLYKANNEMQQEAKKEYDPVETTLDGLEEYFLDPVGNLTPGQAAAGLAALTAAGVGGKYLYDNRKR